MKLPKNAELSLKFQGTSDDEFSGRDASATFATLTGSCPDGAWRTNVEVTVERGQEGAISRVLTRDEVVDLHQFLSLFLDGTKEQA